MFEWWQIPLLFIFILCYPVITYNFLYGNAYLNFNKDAVSKKIQKAIKFEIILILNLLIFYLFMIAIGFAFTNHHATTTHKIKYENKTTVQVRDSKQNAHTENEEEILKRYTSNFIMQKENNSINYISLVVKKPNQIPSTAYYDIEKFTYRFDNIKEAYIITRKKIKITQYPKNWVFGGLLKSIPDYQKVIKTTYILHLPKP